MVKIYDAIEQVQSQGLDPRLITISGVDVRDENIIPEHYVSVWFLLVIVVIDFRNGGSRPTPIKRCLRESGLPLGLGSIASTWQTKI